MSIDLRPFCASEHDSRAWLRHPFTLNGKTCASNGHILIEMDIAGDYPEVPSKNASNVAASLGRIPAAGFQPLPTMPEPEFVACPSCEGRGHGKRCKSCEGAGEFQHHGHSYSCKACDGEGSFNAPCYQCNATGKKEISIPMQIGEAVFALRYLSLIATLPCVEFATTRANDIAGFKFQGGRGVLMPLRS
ncbi:hypothetical protein [Chromobacterium violaceum]|uniref:hypothetical protein n=1 Tax=Chromobacterium violaceum TaxID=536 RepID=UPI00111BEE97|nr:hypothetical protein [Chromobacterium violaceum]